MISSSNFRYEVDKTIDKMFLAEMMRRKRYYTEFVKGRTAPPGEDYTEGTLSEFGIARTLTQGGRPDLDMPVEGNKVTRTYTQVGLSTMLTKIVLDDDITGKWKQLPAKLVDSIVERIEYDAAGILTNGFATNKGEDGNYLFLDTHSSLKGAVTIDNLSTADLSTTSLEAAFNYGSRLVGENGFIRPVKPKILMVPPEAAWVANDLLKSTGRVWDYKVGGAGTSMDLNSGFLVGGAVAAPAGLGAMNQLNPSMGIVDGWKVIVNPYLTNTDSWFVLFEGAEIEMLWKDQPYLKMDYDAGTESSIYHARARYSIFCNKYKLLYGSEGAS